MGSTTNTSWTILGGDSGEGEHYSEGKPNTIPVIANTIGAKRRWQSDCA
jgi:hypothetical protein